MFNKTWIAAAALAAAVSLPAHADIVTLIGDTTGDPTFTRALEDFSAPSAVGVGVRYDAYTLTVSLAGDYSFLTTGAFDTFTFLYTTFNPANPLAGGIVGNDDLVNVGTSGFSASLLANTAYTLVVTGYLSSDFGAHSTTIGGPGTISAVPEPAPFALLAVGMGLIALRRRFGAYDR